MSKENSPKMRIFILTKIDSGPEKQVEAEVWGTIKITNKTDNNILDFILFLVFHTSYESVTKCPDFLALSANTSHRPSFTPTCKSLQPVLGAADSGQYM